jgi:hypothetical protein
LQGEREEIESDTSPYKKAVPFYSCQRKLESAGLIHNRNTTERVIYHTFSQSSSKATAQSRAIAMGRPSLTATSARRPTTRSENEEEETFPRRFPRTGNLFQVKALPDINPSYRSERERPLLMSSDVPYCTVDEQYSGKFDRYQLPECHADVAYSLARDTVYVILLFRSILACSVRPQLTNHGIWRTLSSIEGLVVDRFVLRRRS